METLFVSSRRFEVDLHLVAVAATVVFAVVLVVMSLQHLHFL